jgi:murein DD-endopeptidase MepM/ murein hydrolase activator NlpD
MLLQSDLDCTFAIDDQPKQSLKAGDTVRISVTLGQHLVTAVSADGKDRWKTVVDADKPVQKVVLIELVKVRAARQAAERQVAQLKQEIAAKERQVKELREKTEASQQQQAAVGTQRKRNEDQVNALGTLMPVPSIEKTPAFRVAYVPFRAHWGTMTVGKAEISFRAEDEKVSFDFVFRDVQDVKSSLYATNKFGPGLQIRLKDGKRYRFATYNNYGSLMDAINRAMAQSK